MSVLVRSIEMPENCRDCEFWCMHRNTHRMYCKSINRQLEADEENEIENKRLSDCHLVEVPAPHGDLIDADTLIKSFNTMEQTQIIKLIKSLIDLQPTVIETEEAKRRTYERRNNG